MWSLFGPPCMDIYSMKPKRRALPLRQLSLFFNVLRAGLATNKLHNGLNLTVTVRHIKDDFSYFTY